MDEKIEIVNGKKEVKRLRDSILWDLQNQFYSNASIQAWSEGIVPSYITTNSYMANSCKEKVSSFIFNFHLPSHIS